MAQITHNCLIIHHYLANNKWRTYVTYLRHFCDICPFFCFSRPISARRVSTNHIRVLAGHAPDLAMCHRLSQ